MVLADTLFQQVAMSVSVCASVCVRTHVRKCVCCLWGVVLQGHLQVHRLVAAVAFECCPGNRGTSARRVLGGHTHFLDTM